MRIPLPESVQFIIDRLQAHGYDAYAVGGCVRDAMLGRDPGDWDLTTSALPEQIKKIFSRTVDTGIAHGTVTVLHGGGSYEVTTFREDGDYADGRHPDSVRFVPCLKEDLLRRDFTINAMAYNPTAGLVDLYGGREDLANRTIRCVGDPMARFGEDALRMLRAVRFAAQLDFSIEPATYEAIGKLRENLLLVSAERIRVELVKLLLSDHPQSFILAVQTGLADRMVPEELKLSEGRTEGLTCLPEDQVLRLAAFLRRLDAETILKKLKFDNETIRRVRILTAELPFLCAPDPVGVRRELSRLGEALFYDKLTLQEFVIGLKDREWTGQAGLTGGETSANAASALETVKRTRILADEILKRGDCLTLKELAITGNDLLSLGVPRGSRVGALLKEALELVLAEPKSNRKEILMKYLEDHYGLHETL